MPFEETDAPQSNGKRINWYPGHMAKARRSLETQIKNVDVVIELCDARLPRASRNPDLIKMTGGKKHVLILQKADLADPAETDKWLIYFRSLGITCAAIDVNKQYKTALRLIDDAAKETVQRAEARGIKKTVRAMVIGVPNVGKSTLINRLHGSRIAQAGDRPGVTRSNQWVKITPYLEILDTPGLLWPRLDDQHAAMRLSYIAAIKDQIQDMRALTLSLLDDMMDMKPAAVIERYKIKDDSLRGEELLYAACKGRGWLMKGGVFDEERACAVIPDEFRGGKLGRLTLEKAPAPYEPEKRNSDG